MHMTPTRSRHSPLASSPFQGEANWRLDRRRLLLQSAAAIAAASLAGVPAEAATRADPMTPIPIPPQVPAKDGVAQVAGTKLFYWDTGGNGAPVVLLHPATGSALIWGYQQPVFARSG